LAVRTRETVSQTEIVILANLTVEAVTGFVVVETRVRTLGTDAIFVGIILTLGTGLTGACCRVVKFAVMDATRLTQSCFLVHVGASLAFTRLCVVEQIHFDVVALVRYFVIVESNRTPLTLTPRAAEILTTWTADTDALKIMIMY
jgi:hypothetical protein